MVELDKIVSYHTWCQKGLTLNIEGKTKHREQKTNKQEKKKTKHTTKQTQPSLSLWKMLEVIDSRLFKFIHRRA